MKFEFKEIRDLYDIYDNSFGLTKQDIEESEERLSIKLPAVLREYYLQLGNHELNRKQDLLPYPSELRFTGKDEILLIYSENQGVSVCGVKKQDLGLENPPVYICLENNLPPDNKVWEYENSLYDFLISNAYLQSLYVFPFSANSISISTETERQVRKFWNNTHRKTKIWGTKFYQNDFCEVLGILKVDAQTDLYIATKTVNRLKEICEKLNCEWEYYNIEESTSYK